LFGVVQAVAAVPVWSVAAFLGAVLLPFLGDTIARGAGQRWIKLALSLAFALFVPGLAFAAADGGKIQLAKAGDRAKFPGTINVTDGGRYGDNQWFGRIHRDGKFEAGRDATDAITEVLQQFAADPAGYAAKYGRTTGNCCFCQKTLTDAKSTGVGYGPVCAKNYGLAWGKAAPAALEPANQDCPEAEYAQAEMDNRQPNVEHSWA